MAADIVPSGEPRHYGFQIEHVYSHDRGAFTQGLLAVDGVFYESTGLYGLSSLRELDREKGDILRRLELAAEYYGEGLALHNGKLIQLTWQSRKGFVYDRKTFALEKEFSYHTEGWGLTTDGNRLIVSDGSAYLFFWNSQTFAESGRILVTDRGRQVPLLNELEFVKGDVFANVWKTEQIAIIDPDKGTVKGWIDLHGLSGNHGDDPENVLNGIAYDSKEDRLFVTGKRWPHIFEITIVPTQ